MTHRSDLLRMTGSVAREPAIPVEHSRPQRLTTNAEDSRELDVRRLRRIAIHRRQVCPHQNVAIRHTIWEFLRGIRAGTKVYGGRHHESGALERSFHLFRAIRERDSDARRVDDLAERAAARDTHR